MFAIHHGYHIMTDITLDLSGIIINLRVGALIKQDGQILICRLPSEDWWYIPGGRITAGETSLQALRRELSEELEGEYAILGPALSSENFFVLNGQRFQEQCIYYDIEWQSDPKCLKVFSHEEFRWIPIDTIGQYDVRPAFLAKAADFCASKMRHIIHQDG